MIMVFVDCLIYVSILLTGHSRNYYRSGNTFMYSTTQITLTLAQSVKCSNYEQTSLPSFHFILGFRGLFALIGIVGSMQL